MTGIFEHIAAFDDSQQVANRQAVAVANKRVKDRYLPFLSGDAAERKARLSYVEDEIRQVIADVVGEYGGDPEKIEAAVRSTLSFDDYGGDYGDPHGEMSHGRSDMDLGLGCGRCGGQGAPVGQPCQECGYTGGSEEDPSWGGGPHGHGHNMYDQYPQDQPDPGFDEPTYTANVREARRPKMCPYHSEVVDVSLGSGDPQAGYNAMASHAWSPNHCKGGFEGNCNFRPEMVTQSFWDGKKQEYEQRAQEREQQRLQEEQAPLFEERTPEQQQLPEQETDFDIDHEMEHAPSAVGDGGGELGEEAGLTPAMAKAQQMLAARQSNPLPVNPLQQPPAVPGAPPAGMAPPMGVPPGPPGPPGQMPGQPGQVPGQPLPPGMTPEEMEMLQQQHPGHPGQQPLPPMMGSDSTGLADDPSPKMDKKKWKPNALNEDGNLPEINVDGGPYKTDRQDAPDKADYKSDNFKADSPVVDHESLPTASDVDSAGFASGGEEHGKGGTWSGNDGQTNPVTHEVQSAQDIDKNPLREILESEFEGFVPSSVIQSAVKEFHAPGDDPS